MVYKHVDSKLTGTILSYFVIRNKLAAVGYDKFIADLQDFLMRITHEEKAAFVIDKANMYRAFLLRSEIEHRLLELRKQHPDLSLIEIKAEMSEILLLSAELEGLLNGS